MAIDASRNAGVFARDRFRARRRAWLRRVWWVLVLIPAGVVGVAVGVGALVAPRHLGFYLGFGLGIAVTMVLAFADSPPNHIERWRQGADGEKATAKQLRRLLRRGWVLFNDVDIGRGNIDHVAVGPPGVFVLETKALHGLLTVERGVLSVRWREDPGDGYENHKLTPRMRQLARIMERRLADAGMHTVPVQPLVVLWGAFDQRSVQSKDGVAWVGGKVLADVLERRPQQLSLEQVQEVATSLQLDGG